MTDTALDVRGTPAVNSSDTSATVPATSDPDTVSGDYIAVFASVDYKSAGITIANTTGVTDLSGAAGWTSTAAASDGAGGDLFTARSWVGRVSTDGAKTVTVSQGTSGSGLHLAVVTLIGLGGTLTLDGSTTIADRSSPYTHGSISPAGTRSRLFAFHGCVRFSSNPVNYNPAPSGGIPELAERLHNTFSGLQVCSASLTAAGATGTINQADTTNPTVTNTYAAGGMFALRLDVVSTPSGPEPGRALLAA